MTDTYSKEKLKSLLPFTGGIEILDDVPSTNDYAKSIMNDLPDEVLKKGYLIIAGNQTRGKGRLGRTWISNHDDTITMSFVIKTGLGLADMPMLTIATAVAVRNGIREISGEELYIKWPNDIVREEDGKIKKVCGILCETVASNNPPAIIGIGINIHKTEFPEEIADIASYVEKNREPEDRCIYVSSIINNLVAAIETVVKNGGLGELQKEYVRRCICIGRKLRTTDYNSNGSSVTGTGKGIDERGRLIIETEFGQMTLDSGEISVRIEH